MIKAVLKDPEDKTQLSLLYANQTPEDILLWDELEALAAQHDNLQVWYTGVLLAAHLLLAHIDVMDDIHQVWLQCITTPH